MTQADEEVFAMLTDTDALTLNAEEACTILRQLPDWHDQEFAHIAADKILLAYLRFLEQHEMIRLYQALSFWYA